MGGSLKKAIDWYSSLYKDASDAIIEERLGGIEPSSLSLSLATTLDLQSIEHWRDQTNKNGNRREPPNGGWDWKTIHASYLKNPRRFVLTLKHNGIFCGIFAGGISKSKEVTKIHYIEAAPEITPLSGLILDFSFGYAVTLGYLVDSKYVAVYEPNSYVFHRAIEEFGFISVNHYGTDKMLKPLYLDLDQLVD